MNSVSTYLLVIFAVLGLALGQAGTAAPAGTSPGVPTSNSSCSSFLGGGQLSGSSSNTSDCKNFTGLFYSFWLFQMKPNATMTPDQLLSELQMNLSSSTANKTGFVEFAGVSNITVVFTNNALPGIINTTTSSMNSSGSSSNSTNSTLAYIYSVFTNQNDSKAFSDQVAMFYQSNLLSEATLSETSNGTYTIFRAPVPSNLTSTNSSGTAGTSPSTNTTGGTTGSCMLDSMGAWISIRVYSWEKSNATTSTNTSSTNTTSSNITSEQILLMFKQQFVSTLDQQKDLKEYGGIGLADGFLLFYSIHNSSADATKLGQTESSAIQSTAQSSPTPVAIHQVDSILGIVAFDDLCNSAGSSGSTNTNAGTTPAAGTVV